jgi:hypothetical protein
VHFVGAAAAATTTPNSYCTAVSREFAIGLYPATSFNDQSNAYFCKPHFASYQV